MQSVEVGRARVTWRSEFPVGFGWDREKKEEGKKKKPGSLTSGARLSAIERERKRETAGWACCRNGKGQERKGKKRESFPKR